MYLPAQQFLIVYNFIFSPRIMGFYQAKFDSKRLVGFSVIELMIATMLGTLLLLILTTVYGVVKQNYLLEQTEAIMQSNASTVIDILQQELRMAGFIGCARINQLATPLKYGNKFFSAENSVLGSQGVGSSWQPNLPVRLYDVKPDTDVIVFWARQARSYRVAQGSDGSLINFTENIPFEMGDILLLSSCDGAELLAVDCKKKPRKSCNKQDLRIAKPLNSYQQAELAPLSYYAYFIRQSIHLSQDGQAIYSLFRKSLDSLASAQELVAGIESMKISYGIKISSRATLIFLPAGQVQNWQEVYVIRIALLMTSINNVLDKPQSYQFNGKLHPAKDRRLRREWVTYIPH